MPVRIEGCTFDNVGTILVSDRPEEATIKNCTRNGKPLTDDWMRVAPGTDAAIWRPWGRETGEL